MSQLTVVEDLLNGFFLAVVVMFPTFIFSCIAVAAKGSGFLLVSARNSLIVGGFVYLPLAWLASATDGSISAFFSGCFLVVSILGVIITAFITADDVDTVAIESNPQA